MPWHQSNILSIQLGSLKSFLEKNDFKVDSRHYYKDIISYINISMYEEILCSHIGELFFAALLFPRKRNYIREVIKNKLGKNFNFERCLKNISVFIDDILKDVTWSKYDIVCFTITHEQFLSSLFLAKLLKSKFPGIKIVFGGLLLVDNLAKNIIKLFPFIDYVVMGEGEIPLLELLFAFEGKEIFSRIPSLVYKKKGRILINPQKEIVYDINSFSVPDYTDFFKYNLKSSNKIFYPRISIEASRGCWWGKCIFCVENKGWHKSYRRKTSSRVVNEIEILTKKNKTTNFIFTDSDISDKIDIFREIKNLRLKLNIRAEVSGFISKKSLEILRQAGVTTIQIGIESFSERLLKIYNKGVRLMKMVELLKWCKELGIELYYNIILGAPFELKEDLGTIIENMEFLKYFQPPHISRFVVSYQSLICHNPKKYGIIKLLPPTDVRKCYPKDLNEKLTPLLSFHAGYDFRPRSKLRYNKIFSKIKKWRKISSLKPSLICRRDKNILDIEKKVNNRTQHFIIKREIEKQIYLLCIGHSVSIHKIIKTFPEVTKEKIEQTLRKFVKSKLMFTDNKNYFSLASLEA